MKYFIGIDPGKKGGIALIDQLGNIKEYCQMPESFVETCSVFAQWVLNNGIWHHHCQVHCFIEKVHAMPKQGVVSMFSFGQGYGELRGLCMAHFRNIHEVRPQEWKKGMEVTSDKESSIAKCEELFPAVNLIPTKRSRKPSDGIAEAILIAEYGRRKSND